MRAGWLAAALAGSVVLLGACAQVYDSTTLGVPVTMAGPAGAAVAGDSFSVTSHAVWALWGAVSVKQPSVEKVLASQLLGGKAVRNVRIRTRSRFSDVLFTILTAGILVPRSVTVEGVVTSGP